MKVQGKDENTRLQHALRYLRGCYMENVRSGRYPLDKAALEECDELLETLNGKHVSAKRS